MIARKVNPTAKVAIFAVAHATYWDQFEGLYDNIMGYHKDFVEMEKSTGVEVLDFGMVDSSEKSYAVADKITGTLKCNGPTPLPFDGSIVHSPEHGTYFEARNVTGQMQFMMPFQRHMDK